MRRRPVVRVLPALVAVAVAALALAAPATCHAEKKGDNSLDTNLFKLEWGAGLSVLRYRGVRTALCRPDPCIEGKIEFAPISPAAWIYLEPSGLRIGDVQLIDLAFMAGLTVKEELSDVQDLYTGIGIGVLNRYLVIGIRLDLWRKTTELAPGGTMTVGPASGLLEGRANGPGGFRWTENAGFFFALDFTNIFGAKDKAKDSGTGQAAAAGASGAAGQKEDARP